MDTSQLFCLVFFLCFVYIFIYSQHFGRPRWADHKVRSLRPAWPTW
uniref:Macaca fascicularis brain cDNA clone: QflA-16288, similar to human growth arrest-specific 7 (GAS7), transcript variant c, mRNA, RefSeq: NM_201433.1 n=1 Tax=Macaca fascicularis TaxID=9541 RepID=I7G4Z4_MACFA|nr:unnamed protein product [Macaca fascicularis]